MISGMVSSDMYVLHIGAPKTGTTSLQNAFGSLSIQLAEHNICYLNTKAFQKSEIGQFLRGKVERPQAAIAALKSAIFSGSQILLSDEGMTGSLMNPAKTGWRGAANRAFIFTELMCQAPDKVVITLRRQDDYLRSCYLHRLRHGRIDVDFETYWRREINIEWMRWSLVLEELESFFGRDRLVVMLYEAMRSDFHDYLQDFFYLTFGMRLEKDDFSPQHSNKGLDDALAEAVLDRIRDLKMVGAKIDAIKEEVNLLIEAEPNASGSRDLHPVLHRAMKNELRTDNEYVVKRYGLLKHEGFLFTVESD